MKRGFLITGIIVSVLLGIVSITGMLQSPHETKNIVETPPLEAKKENYRAIEGVVVPGETMYEVFIRYGLDIQDLFSIREASANIFSLRNISAGQNYKLLANEQNKVLSFIYRMNDDYILKIVRDGEGFTPTSKSLVWGFTAEKTAIEYEKRVAHIGGIIDDNLISSVGEGKDKNRLALNLSDIFAWDIDFTTDIRNGDIFKMIVEELYENGEFIKYGNILAAEFVNNGDAYNAYRFEHNDIREYYNKEGKLLRRAFLKAPLNYRRISSGFSMGRFHPILKKYRPHHGVDYAAPSNTPVSTVGDGTVLFAGYKGGYGKLLIIRHPNGYETRYGHLSKFAKGIKRGLKIAQGDTIGYVGTTGITTGPHLHYEMRLNSKFINPIKIKIPTGRPLPDNAREEFIQFTNTMTSTLASINPITAKVASKDNEENVDEEM